MSKCIDADKLIKKLDKMIDNIPASIDSGAGYVIDEVYNIIDSLQQEQPEVDLKEEIMKWQGYEAFPEGTNITPLPKAMDIVERTAQHFYELGLNARKE